MVTDANRLFPPDVAIAWRSDQPDDSICDRLAVALPPSAVLRRRREFAAGRLCAVEACKSLGLPEGIVPIAASGEPVWPETVVGSISHTAGMAIAAVAKSATYACIGLDVEIHERLPAEVVTLILSLPERNWIRARTTEEVAWDRLFFSAKEAAFKAWFHLARRPLDFSDIAIDIRPGSASFTATVLRAGGLSQLEGKFCVTRNYIFTAVAVPRPRRCP